MSSSSRKYQFCVISASLNEPTRAHGPPKALKVILSLNGSLFLETSASVNLLWNESTVIPQSTLRNATIRCDLCTRAWSLFPHKKTFFGRGEIKWNAVETEIDTAEGEAKLLVELSDENSRLVGSLHLSVTPYFRSVPFIIPRSFLSPKGKLSGQSSAPPAAPTGSQRLIAVLHELKTRVPQTLAVHILACVAWRIVTTVMSTPGLQSSLDNQTTRLLLALNACCDFGEFLKDPDSPQAEWAESRIAAILRQTIECMLFIKDRFDNVDSPEKKPDGSLYAIFLERAEALARSDPQDRDVIDALVTYKAGRGELVTYGDIPALRSIPIRGLHPIPSSLSSCLPETRSDILEDISTWLTTSAGRLYILDGAPGSGKTAIAQAIASFFQSQNRLAAQVFFARDSPLPSSPAYFIRHLAHQLTELYDKYATKVAARIRAYPRIHEAPLATQFNELLVVPLSELQLLCEGPLIVVIDGLDQCGTEASRKSLLSVLDEQIDLLPRTFRFFVTTRDTAPNATIRIMSNPHSVVAKKLQNADKDIAALFEHAFYDVRNSRRGQSLGLSWPGKKCSHDLVRQANSSFMWAWTVCQLLREVEHPDSWLKNVLSHEGLRGDASIDHLYLEVMKTFEGDQKEERVEEFQATFGILLCAEESMDFDLAQDMAKKLSDVSLLETLPRFQFALLHTRLPSFEIIRLHASFCDFFANADRCVDPNWFIDIPSHRYQQTVVILDYLPDEVQRVLSTPTHPAALGSSDGAFFKYASYYWIDYVTKCPPDQTLRTKVLYFVLHGFSDWFTVAENDSRTRLALLIEWLEQPCVPETTFSPCLVAALLKVIHAYSALEQALPGDLQLREIARQIARVRSECDGLFDPESLLAVERRYIFGQEDSESRNRTRVIGERVEHGIGPLVADEGDAEEYGIPVSEEEKRFKQCVACVVDARNELTTLTMEMDGPAGEEYRAWELAMSQASASKMRHKVNQKFLHDVERIGASALRISEEDMLRIVEEAMRIGSDNEDAF
ncbi:hypothetical protein BXZ70DRAFT_951107 [Cristinia sonorae]|uniref:NACHT domain-containing protein n=1 Tax=Cristinia sonorae TaxID=1940300 RepID=A0A8K0UIR5_9AGAR|nr:hypothetical protein BXZ70DRAFT_951107 [Cristinia sonorae]